MRKTVYEKKDFTYLKNKFPVFLVILLSFVLCQCATELAACRENDIERMVLDHGRNPETVKLVKEKLAPYLQVSPGNNSSTFIRLYRELPVFCTQNKCSYVVYSKERPGGPMTYRPVAYIVRFTIESTGSPPNVSSTIGELSIDYLGEAGVSISASCKR